MDTTELEEQLHQMETDEVTLNMGPQHPSTHGALRLILKIDGERVVSAIPDFGYVHRGFEKIAENMTYIQYGYLTDRMDYLSAILNEWCYAMAVEKLEEIEIPKRADYLRVISGELCRLSSHLVWLGSMGMDLGAFTPLTYCFREREMILELFDLLCGQRMTFNYCRIGGVARDLPVEFDKQARAFISTFKTMPDMYDELLSKNAIFIARTKGVGLLPKEMAHHHAVTGPNLRGSGVDLDLRKSAPYSVYSDFDFNVVTEFEGDALARYRVRVEEMRQSLRIIEQALDGIPAGEIMAKVPKVIKPKAGEAYVRLESSRGIQGFYLVSDGTPKPSRCRIRVPSFANLSVLPKILKGVNIADVVAIMGSIDFIVPEIDR